MKKWMILFLAALALAGCAKKSDPPATTAVTEPPIIAEPIPETTQSKALDPSDLVGPWYLDTGKNDLKALRVLFGSSMASGTGMEIRSNGQISFSIGAGAGGAGTYTVEGNTLVSRLVSFAESDEQEFRFEVTEENGKTYIMQNIYDTTVYWTQDAPDAASDLAISDYSAVLDLYNRALHEGWDVETCRDNEVNYLLAMGGQDAASIGWVLQDVDSDGSKELLIGPVGQPNIYALYTLENGSPKQLIDAGERSAWYLEPDGILVNDGSSSAFLHHMMFYWLKNGKLDLNNGLISDYAANEAEPWFLTTDTDDSRNNDTKITTARAEELVRAYQSNYVSPDYTPFSQYAAG